MKILSFLSLTSLLVIGASSLQAQSSQVWMFDNKSDERRFFRLSKEIACPTCEGAPISESTSPVAKSLRRELQRLIIQGLTDEEIYERFQSQYGDQVLLNPAGQNRKTLYYAAFVVFISIFLFWLSSFRN